jgi:hypothetical protein
MLPQHQNEPWDSGRYRANHTKYLANSGFRIVDPLGRSIPFRKIFTSGMPGPPDWARSLQPLRPKQAAYTSWWLKYEQRNPVEKLPLVINKIRNSSKFDLSEVKNVCILALDVMILE